MLNPYILFLHKFSLVAQASLKDPLQLSYFDSWCVSNEVVLVIQIFKMAKDSLNN